MPIPGGGGPPGGGPPKPGGGWLIDLLVAPSKKQNRGALLSFSLELNTEIYSTLRV